MENWTKGVNSSINTGDLDLGGAWGKEGRIHKIEICTVRSLTIYINKLRGSCEADAVAAVPDYDKNEIASNLSVASPSPCPMTRNPARFGVDDRQAHPLDDGIEGVDFLMIDSGEEGCRRFLEGVRITVSAEEK